MTKIKYYKEGRLYHCSECNKDHYYWSKKGKDHEKYCDVIYYDGLVSVGYKCNKCGEWLKRTNEFFSKDKSSYDGLGFRCKLCKTYENIEYHYGLDRKAYKEMYDEQSGRCALCRKNLYLPNRILKTNIHVDHNHETGIVRGMLCMNCNVNLGWYLKKKNRINEYAKNK